MRLSDLSGKVTLLAFWFPTCGKCRVELPHLEPLYQKFKDKGLEVVAVDVYGDRTGGERFVAENGLSYRFLDGNLDVAERYGVVSTPTMFIIDQDGRIAARTNRFDTNVEQKIRALLNAE